MSVQIIDSMGDVAAWSAVQPDGTTASTELTIVADAKTPTDGSDDVSALVTATGAASGHALQRGIAELNLTGFTELRLSIRSPNPAAVSTAPFLFELRLASAAVGLADPANTWHRLIPSTSTTDWRIVPVSLDDLPAGIANAVNAIQLRCVSGSFAVNIDDVVAAQPQMLLDCDRALIATLKRVAVGDKAVDVAVRAPDEPPPNPPALKIRHVDARYARHRVIDAPARRDYTTTGFREVRAGTPYDIDYAISPVAATRSDQAALLETVLDRLPPNGEVVIDGELCPIELLTLAGTDRIGGFVGDTPVLMYRVGVRGPARVGTPVHDVRQVAIMADLKAGVGV